MIYRYRLYEATARRRRGHYAVLIQPGETIHASDGRTLRVSGVVASEDEVDEYVGMLRVEPLSSLLAG